jgi:hypothetical protein
MPEKNQGAEVVNKLTETLDQNNEALKLSAKAVEEIKSLAASQVESSAKIVDAVMSGFKAMTETKETEEKKSLEVQVKNLEAKLQSYRAGEGSAASKDSQVEEFKSEFRNAINLKTKSDGSFILPLKEVVELKSGVVGFDARRGGLLAKPGYVVPGLLEDKPLAKGISSLIPTIDNAHNATLTFKDISNLNLIQSYENKPAENTKQVIFTQKEIKPFVYKAKIPVSSDILHLNSKGQLSTDIVTEYINSCVDLFNYKKDLTVVTNVIADSGATGNKVNKVLTAASNAVVINDILNAYSALSPFYRTGSVVFAADHKLIDKIFQQVGSDGHPLMEYYTYIDGQGLTNIKTPNGAVKIIPVDTDFFKGYKAFNDNFSVSSTDVSSGYNTANTGNGGKVLGMFIDTQKSIFGIEDSSYFEADLLLEKKDPYNEEAFFGVKGAFNYKTKLEASISLLINKN